MNQKILIDGVKIEKENQAHQASHGLRQESQGVEVLTKVSVRNEKRGQPHGEQKSDNGRGGPQPPFSTFNAPEFRAWVRRSRETWVLETF
jgi:hypothetical protein